MDVRCRRCGTEYELEDARVASSGTAVQCSDCGHIFKVMPGGAAHEATTPGTPLPMEKPTRFSDMKGSAAEWSVRRSDGKAQRCRDLTTLQKWIVERKVSRDDEISRTGRSWRKLGDVSELASFFQVADAAAAAERSAMTAEQRTADADPGAVALGATLVDQEPPPWLSSPLPSTTSPPTPVLTEAAQSAHPTIDADDHEGRDQEDPVVRWRTRRRRQLASVVVGAVVVIVAAGVLALVTDLVQRPSAAPTLPDELAVRLPVVLASDDALAQAEALGVLAAETSPFATTWRARLLAARADAAMDLVRLVERGRALDSTLDVAVVRADAEARLVEAASAFAALGTSPRQGEQASLAKAALALARGDAAGLAAAVDAALAHAPQEARAVVDDELRLLLTLAEARVFDPASPNAAEALAGVQAKLALFDDGRARVAAMQVAVAATVFSAAKQRAAGLSAPDDLIASARAANAKLPEQDPRRLLAQKLLVLAATPPPVDAGVVVAVDGGVLDAALGDGAKGPSSLPPLPADYDGLMRRGEQAFLADQTQRAFEAFKKASDLRPGVARPWLKLGWASLDLGRTAESEKAFAHALDIDPHLAEAQFGRAEALRFAGRKEEAVEAYRAYIAMDPYGRDAEIARRAVEQLQ
jgi:predicted Zn finger-like uncharacterized protein